MAPHVGIASGVSELSGEKFKSEEVIYAPGTLKARGAVHRFQRLSDHMLSLEKITVDEYMEHVSENIRDEFNKFVFKDGKCANCKQKRIEIAKEVVPSSVLRNFGAQLHGILSCKEVGECLFAYEAPDGRMFKSRPLEYEAEKQQAVSQNISDLPDDYGIF